MATTEDDLTQLVCWLAKVVIQHHDCRYEALALPADECKKYLTMKFPSVQGLKIQSILRELGDRELDHDALQRAIEHLQSVQGEQARSKAAPEFPQATPKEQRTNTRAF